VTLGRALLHPRSVAVIGASDDATKTTGRPLRFLRQAGFAGKVYPVNPNRATVQGETAWPSVEDLPEVPEHAYIVTPTQHALEAVERCGRAGVAVATVLAAGFSEAGAEGLERERALRRIVSDTGIRVVGPSSLGVANMRDGMLLTANAAFAEPDLPTGTIFAASHSGTMIGSLLSRGKARGVGFAGFVSAGNEVDLSVGEICAATLDDPQITGYLLFLETLRRADKLRAFALAAAERGRPVLAYKLGRSAAGAELSMTHTGALAGEDDVADAFFRDCGIARAHTLDGLLEGMPLMARIPIRNRRGARVGVVTTTGGGAAKVVDQLGVRGVRVERFVDLTLAGTKYEVMKGALDELLADPDLDLVVAIPGSSARHEPHLAVRPVIDSAGTDKPLACFVVPDAPQALAQLTQAGVPNFRTPESCADAIAAAFARRLRKGSSSPSHNAGEGAGALLDELASYELLSRLGIPVAPHEALSEPRTTLPYPVAVKVLSASIPHKTEAGGVALGVKDAAALSAAMDGIRSRTGVDRFLVQSMETGLGEALVGYRVDPHVGPIVMLAAGGILAELHRDRSIRMAPVDIEAAREMVAEVHALQALAGFRGRPRGDLEALAAAVVALSNLALATEVDVLEAEVNPMIVRVEGQGVVAVDALVRTA
jgi:acyl-CoA synthetase (NDP forming)